MPLFEEEPYYMLQHANNWLRSYHTVCSSHCMDRQSVICIWIYGPTGTGKSTYSHETMPNAYVKDPSKHWWDGYLQQVDVILKTLVISIHV